MLAVIYINGSRNSSSCCSNCGVTLISVVVVAGCTDKCSGNSGTCGKVILVAVKIKY